MQSDTFTLSPNNVTWNNGDAVELPDHPSVSTGIGQWLTQTEFPGVFNGFGISYYGAVQGSSATLASFANNAPATVYLGHGGNWYAPNGISLSGQLGYDFVANTGGDGGDISIGCSTACNHPYQHVLQVGEAGTGHQDQLVMNENSGQWQLTAGNSNISYFFTKDGLEQPTNLTPGAADSGLAKLNFNSSFQVCLMDSGGTNHCASSSTGGTNATSIQNIPVSPTAPTTNQVLAYNGSQYVPTTPSSGGVTGLPSSTTNDIPTFNGTGGNVLQDTGVRIILFNGTADWIDLPSGGPSAIGTGGVGVTTFLAYAQTASNWFQNTTTSDIVMRNKQYTNIRLGIDDGTGGANSTFDVAAKTVTLNLGVKLTGTHSTTASNAPTFGVITLGGASTTVNTSAISGLATAGNAGDAVQLTLQSCTSCGILSIGSAISGTSFTIKSTNSADASKVFWTIVHIN